MEPLIEVTLRARPAAASEARRSLQPLANKIPEETFEDIRILVSELVTNSVRHGARGQSGAAVKVGVWQEQSCVRVEVTDGGPGFDVDRSARPRTPDQVGGWGLQIVDRLSDRWGVKRASSGASVWFEIDLQKAQRDSGSAGR